MTERLAVIGTGTMGHSIVLNAAWMGIDVVMHGVNEAEIAAGLQSIESKLSLLRENELIDEISVKEILSDITTTTRFEDAIKDVSFVIEAIPEDVRLKQELFHRLDYACASDVILASNTSGIDPAVIAARMYQPQRFIITHFWNPAHLVPLVEIVRSPQTNDATVERAKLLLKRMKKKSIELRRSIPGFIGNRLQYALFREAQFLLQEGIASKEDIDAAVTYSIGRRLPVTGPLLSADMGGLDVFTAISDYLLNELSKADEALPILKNLVKENQLGVKSGKGFYEWSDDFITTMNKKREIELIRFLKQDMQAEISKAEV